MDFRAIIQRNAHLRTQMALAFMRAACVEPSRERRARRDEEEREDPALRACRRQRHGVTWEQR